MLVIQHIDWFGSPDELNEMDEAIKKACKEMEGLTYKGDGRLIKRDTISALFETDAYMKIMDARGEAGFERDYSKLPHSVMEILGGPQHT